MHNKVASDGEFRFPFLTIVSNSFLESFAGIDCIDFRSLDGIYSPQTVDGLGHASACGLYLVGDISSRITVEFLDFNVDCSGGHLVGVSKFDGIPSADCQNWTILVHEGKLARKNCRNLLGSGRMGTRRQYLPSGARFVPGGNPKSAFQLLRSHSTAEDFPFVRKFCTDPV